MGGKEEEAVPLFRNMGQQPPQVAYIAPVPYASYSPGAVNSPAPVYPEPYTAAPAPLYSTEEAEAEEQKKWGRFVADSNQAIRLAFVRKVYTILAAQIGFSMLVGAMMMFSNGGQFKYWLVQNTWAFYVPLIGAVLSLIALFFVRRKTPWNFAVLSFFTFCEAFSIGSAVSLYDSRVVLQAVIITFGLFVALTVFTLQSRWDFSGMGPFLWVAVWALIVAGLIQLFLPYNRITDLVIAIIGALVFCAYTVFDTYMIFNRTSPEDYVIAAVELYLDLLNLFLYILRILNALQSNR